MEEPTDWNAQRERINRLYNVDDKPLSEVRDIMWELYRFKGTEQQYKKRIAAWKLDKKNIKDADMRVMLRKQLKRKVEDGKDSEFFVNEKPVPPHKMNRFTKRKGLDEKMIAAEDMPTPSYITCQTPQSNSKLTEPSEDTEAISKDMQLMMKIPENNQEFDQSKLGTIGDKPTHVQQYHNILYMEDYSHAERSFVARVVLLIWYNDWTDLVIFLKLVPPETWLYPILHLSNDWHFVKWVISRLRGAPFKAVEFALFFIFHLKRLNPDVGKTPGDHYGLFAVAIQLSEHALYGIDKTNSRWYSSLFLDRHPDVSRGEGLSEFQFNRLRDKILPNMRTALVIAKEGEWLSWREKLGKFLELLPSESSGLYDSIDFINVPSEPIDIRIENLEFLCQEAIWARELTNQNDESMFETKPPFKASGLQNYLEQNSASPFERHSARYHLSESPEWYYRDITNSNPLHHLSPIPVSTSSRNGSAGSSRYQRPTSHQLAMLVSTPPLSESHAMEF